jgi:plasmanylethanolamine desaturase
MNHWNDRLQTSGHARASSSGSKPPHHQPNMTPSISEVPCGYSRKYRLFEIAAITIFVSVLSALCGRLALQINSAEVGIWIAVSAVAGVLISDFLSGAAHWAGDTLGDESMPLLGRSFIAPFREHHLDPDGITRHDFVEINGNTCIALAPLLPVLYWTTPTTTGISFFLWSTLALTCFFIFCTNQFHKWAHEIDPPVFVRFLQGSGLILSPRRHSIHHAHLNDHYCITVGWMNPLLAKIQFFRLVEGFVARLRPQLLHSKNGPIDVVNVDHYGLSPVPIRKRSIG